MSHAHHSRSVRLAWNAGWNMSGQLGLAVLTFWLIPYIVKTLGPEGYALYSLLGILSGYFMLLTLGAGAATVKYISEHVGAQRRDALATILGASFWMHGLGVTLGAVAAFTFRHQLASQFFRVGPESLAPAAWVIACAAAGAAFWALAQCGLSILQGLQRYDLSNIFSLAQSAVFLGGVAILLRRGHHIHAIGELYIVVYAVFAWAVLRTISRLSPVLPSWTLWKQRRSPAVRSFFNYSVSAFILQLTWSVTFQGDKLFIGHMLPLKQLTYYIIPSAILQKFWLIPTAITSTAFPMLSELHGAGDREALKRFYRKCSHLVLWLVVPGCVMLMVLAPQFLTLWLGEEFSHFGTWPLRLLTMGYFIYFLGNVPNLASAGMDRIHYAVRAGVALALCCLLFWSFLIPRFGIVGAAWGFFLACASVYIPFLFLINRDFFGMSWREYLEDVCLRPFSAGAVLLAAVWPAHFWVSNWTSLLLLAGICTALYAGVGFLLLDQESHDSLQAVLSNLRGRLALR